MLNKISNWDEADKALKELAEIRRAVEAETNDLNKNIDELKNITSLRLQPILEREKELAKMLETHAESRKDDFRDVRSRELVFGIIGFRKSSSIAYKNAKDVLRKLKDLGMSACYKITETVNKEELGKYNDNVLKKVGASRKEKDNFYYTLKAEEVADNGA